MPFGQSYLIKRFATKAGEGYLRLLGESEQESREYGEALGTFLGGLSAVLTLDVTGGSAQVGEHLSDHDSPGRRWLENNL